MLLASTFTLRIRVSIVALLAGAINGTAGEFILVVVVVVVVMWCRWNFEVSNVRCDCPNRVVRVLILAQIGTLIQGN